MTLIALLEVRKESKRRLTRDTRIRELHNVYLTHTAESINSALEPLNALLRSSTTMTV